MTKQELIAQCCQNHLDVVRYVDTLTAEQFMYSFHGKWTAGQQLSHVYLTLLPFPKVLASKDFILQKFGTTDRPSRDCDTIVSAYLSTSLKAPEQYLPAEVRPEQKAVLVSGIHETLSAIRHLLDSYSEAEMDSLLLPHPLMGHLTIREMFCLMGYHATHHLRQLQQHPAGGN